MLVEDGVSGYRPVGAGWWLPGQGDEPGGGDHRLQVGGGHGDAVQHHGGPTYQGQGSGGGHHAGVRYHDQNKST